MVNSVPYQFQFLLEYLGTRSRWWTYFLISVPSQFVGCSLGLSRCGELRLFFQFHPAVPWEFLWTCSTWWTLFLVSLSVPWEFLGTCWTRQTQSLVSVPFQFFGSSLARHEHSELKFLISVPAQLLVSVPPQFLGSSQGLAQNSKTSTWLLQFLPSSLGPGDKENPVPCFSSFLVSCQFRATFSTWGTLFLVSFPYQFLGSLLTLPKHGETNSLPVHSKFLGSYLGLAQDGELNFFVSVPYQFLGLAHRIVNSVPCFTFFTVPWEFTLP